MKKLMMLSAVAALMLGGSAFAAGPEDPTVQIKAAPASTYKLAPGEFDVYAARYTLDNGNSIRFVQIGRKYWADLKEGGRVELYAVQPHVFMTAAGTRFEFQQDADICVIDNFERLPMPLAMQTTHMRVIVAR